MRNFPPAGYGTWLNWFVSRKRAPMLIGVDLGQRRYRLQWLRSKSWRRTL